MSGARGRDGAGGGDGDGAAQVRAGGEGAAVAGAPDTAVQGGAAGAVQASPVPAAPGVGVDAAPDDAGAQQAHFRELRRVLRSLVNRVSAGNIRTIVVELFKENLSRGRGLLATAVLRAQNAQPEFAPVYAALVAVVNSRLGDVGALVVHRLLAQVDADEARGDQADALRRLAFLAHLCNQRVVGPALLLEGLERWRRDGSGAAAERMVAVLTGAGELLETVAGAAVQPHYDALRRGAARGAWDERVRFGVGELLAARRGGFAGHPAVVAELDLLEDEDVVVHDVHWGDARDVRRELDEFRYDPDFAANERKWGVVRDELLGASDDDPAPVPEPPAPAPAPADEEVEFEDRTGASLVFLKKKIYVCIVSCSQFEECVHKLRSLRLRDGEDAVVAEMVVECCAQQRSYTRFYGLVAERFCAIDARYAQHFVALFYRAYDTIHLRDLGQIRNVGLLFAHLLQAGALPWTALHVVRMNERDSTPSSRIFVKTIVVDLYENIGLDALRARLYSAELGDALSGLLPSDSRDDIAFAYNFFAGIGLKELGQPLKERFKALREAGE